MKSICFLIYSIAGVGGTERVCCEIANSLERRGYNVSILSIYNQSPSFKLNDNIAVKSIYNVKRHSKLAIPATVYLLRCQIRKIKPNVLVSVDTALFSYALMSTLLLKVKNIVWEHFNFNVSLNADVRVTARKLAARFSDAIVTLTDRDKCSWQDHLNCRNQIITIPNPSPFSVQMPIEANRKPIVLSVGRLSPQKGFDRLLQAWAKIDDDVKEKWQLQIVGSGQLKASLNKLIESHELTKSVEVIESNPNIHQHYNDASIYCMTSRFEGFPMVLIEAQSFGLPIISYNCPNGPAEIVNEHNGRLIEDGNETELVVAMKELMIDKEKRLKMGRAAYVNAAKYDLETITDQWVRLLKNI